MKFKRIIRLTILVSLLLMLSSIQTLAFSDIKESDWFYDDVMKLTEKNIISGYSKDIFDPYGDIKNGESLKMLFSTAKMEAVRKPDNSHWAEGWKVLGISKGVIDNDFNLNQPTTRSEVAKLIVDIFNLQVDSIPNNVFKDTNDKYSATLYKLGIVNGSKINNEIYFYPNSPISRAEMSSIIVRLDDYKAKSFLYDPSIKEDTSYSKSPTTKAEIRKVLLYMLKNNLYELSVYYDDVQVARNDKFKNTVFTVSEEIMGDYPEYSAFINKIGWKTRLNENRIIFIRDNSYFTNEQIIKMRKEFETKSKEVVLDLYSTGKINKGMTETEKAKVLFEWIIANANYDYNISNEGYNGYGLLFNNLATCQGYTGTFNYMAKLLGIKVRGALGYTNNEYHIWTIAELDGKMTYIDVTHGDMYDSDEPNYDYFDMSPKKLRETHILEDSRYKLDYKWD